MLDNGKWTVLMAQLRKEVQHFTYLDRISVIFIGRSAMSVQQNHLVLKFMCWRYRGLAHRGFSFRKISIVIALVHATHSLADGFV